MAQVSGIEVRFSGNTQPLEQAVNRAEGALTSFGKTAGNVIPVNFGSKVQQASYQIQDFAVQVASGTSATRAFAQQAPQLLSGFGLVGTILGTVAAIAVPLAGSFLATSDAAGTLGTALSSIGPYAALATAALAGFYAPALLAGLTTTTSLIGTGLVGAIRAVTAAMLANPLGLLVAGVAAAAVALFAFRDDLKQIFGVDFVGVIKDATNWTIDKFVKLGKTIGAVWGNIGNIVGNAIVGAANIALRAITGMVNGGIAGINKLVDAVNSLSDYTGITLSRFKELEAFQFDNVFAEGAAKAGSEIGKIWAQSQVTDYVGEMAKLATGAMSKVGEMFSGAFGGSAAADGKGSKGKKDAQTSVNPSQEEGMYFADRLKRIQDHFKTERELLQAEYAADQQVLDNALLNKRVSEEEYYALSQKLAQEHQDTLKAIQATALQTNLGAASDFFGSMAQIFEMGGKKTTKIAKVFAIAQALISTFQGAAKALTLPFPANLAAYATTLAQGLSAVASIKSINENGGGGGSVGGKGSAAGSGGGGGAGGGGGPTTTFQFTLMNDPMGFGEKFARQFIDQLNSTQRNGGQIRGVIA